MNKKWQPEATWLKDINNLELRIGHRFNNQSLIIEALTHSTFSYEHTQTGLVCNERLEFLGDSVLGLTVCEHLFNHLPNTPEGKLSKLKSRLVCEQTLAEVAAAWQLSEVLLLGHGEKLSNGANKASNLANAVEAVIGAVFCDAGFEKAAQITLTALDGFIKKALNGGLIYDYKSLLIEKIQTKYHSSQITFRVLSTSGPAHAPQFEIGIFLLDTLLAKAIGSSKKEAEQLASKYALERLEKSNVFKIN